MPKNAFRFTVIRHFEDPGFPGLIIIRQANKRMATVMFKLGQSLFQVIRRDLDCYELIAPLTNCQLATPRTRYIVALVHREVRNGIFRRRFRLFQRGTDCFQHILCQALGGTITRICQSHDRNLIFRSHQEIGDVPRAATAVADNRYVSNAPDLETEAIEQHARANGYSVVESLVGHGIGRELHEDPQVPNYRCFTMPDPVMEEGLVIAIEPMINAGTKRVVTARDEWTIVTADKELSAHFEHTVAVTADGPRILTRRGSGIAAF